MEKHLNDSDTNMNVYMDQERNIYETSALQEFLVGPENVPSQKGKASLGSHHFFWATRFVGRGSINRKIRRIYDCTALPVIFIGRDAKHLGQLPGQVPCDEPAYGAL